MDIEKSLEFVKPKIMLFSQTRAAKFSQVELRAMKNLYKELYGEDLNMYCAPCVVKCADKLYYYITNGKSKTVDSKDSDLNSMSMPELRDLAKTMNVKSARSKEDIIYNIENNVEAEEK